MGRSSRAARDWALSRAARRIGTTEIIWDDVPGGRDATPTRPEPGLATPLKAAE